MMKELITRIIFFLRKRSSFVRRHIWDYEYSNGEWDFIKSRETRRIRAAKELLERNVQSGNILEIGCGEGVFFQNILDLNFDFYEGIDVSIVAISKIIKTENSTFCVADMETYVPQNAPFSIIVFNEVLYYSKDPMRLLLKYKEFLKKDGVFLIGMYAMPTSDNIWNQISHHFTVLESIEVIQGETKWDYKIIEASNGNGLERDVIGMENINQNRIEQGGD